jgi:hypothetical protein
MRSAHWGRLYRRERVVGAIGLGSKRLDGTLVPVSTAAEG